MRVTPDGAAHPAAETFPAPIRITIRKRSEVGWEIQKYSEARSPLAGFDVRYVITLEGQSIGLPFMTPPGGGVDLLPSGVDFRARVDQTAPQRQALEDVEAIYWRWPRRAPIVLSLRRADRDWVFFIYQSDLITDAEVRHLNTYVPTQVPQIEAGAEVSFLTGACVQDS
jgi:hypothetical protein